MSRTLRIILIILVVDLLLVLAYLGYRALSAGGSEAAGAGYEWVRIDENYYPKDYIEEFIKQDSESRDLLPVFIKNYGKDTKILKKFRGKRFAGPNEALLRMQFRDLEDWQLIELKYMDDRDREIKRTILYVLENEAWKVGDNGTLTR